ncbi:helix-turn-helix transcriptional regulator [Jannaschia sp. Os4]|uniref:helix-turn-helix domain-containing protein n=1 Tax=Jannaschia sp. Os4 TaxID=2807617 RepID=UPI00193A57A7|nr:AraC family transcriptional regulator [Jannaschia sp. Os4]MBM2578134.1 helix-turn-helix transcriptional regulator [Jannaschia sp. Os4]
MTEDERMRAERRAARLVRNRIVGAFVFRITESRPARNTGCLARASSPIMVLERVSLDPGSSAFLREADGSVGRVAEPRTISLVRDITADNGVSTLILVLDAPTRGIPVPDLARPLHAGDLALVPPGKGGTAGVRGNLLCLRMPLSSSPPIARRIDDPLIPALLRRAWALRSAEGEIARATVRLLDLLIEHALQASADSPRPTNARRAIDPRIARAVQHLEAHLAEPFAVADLAAVANLSPSHFARRFKAETGEPTWSYVQRRRCERARALLPDTTLPIAEIAHRCGFSHHAHLTRNFRNRYGLTPSMLRAYGAVPHDG